MVGRFKGSAVTPFTEVVELYLEDVARMRGARTPRAYRGPLRLYTRHLKETLGRDPLLSDLTLESALSWMDTLGSTKNRKLGGRQCK